MFGRAGVGGAGGADPFGGAAGFGGFSDIFDAFFGGADGGRGARAAGRRARTCATTSGSRSRRRSSGAEKEIEFPVLGRCETCGGIGRQGGHRARRSAPSATGRGEVRSVRQTMLGQMVNVARLPALPGRGQDRREPVRDLPGRGPHRAPPEAAGDDPGRHRRGPPDPPLQRGRGRAARRAGGQPVRRGPRGRRTHRSRARAPSCTTRPISRSPRRPWGRGSRCRRSTARTRRSRSRPGPSRGRRSACGASGVPHLRRQSVARRPARHRQRRGPVEAHEAAARAARGICEGVRRDRVGSGLREKLGLECSTVPGARRRVDAGGGAASARRSDLDAAACRARRLAGALRRRGPRGRRGRVARSCRGPRRAAPAWSRRSSWSTRGSRARVDLARPALVRAYLPLLDPAAVRAAVARGRARRSGTCRRSGCGRSATSPRASSTRPTGPMPGRRTSRCCASGAGS